MFRRKQNDSKLDYSDREFKWDEFAEVMDNVDPDLRLNMLYELERFADSDKFSFTNEQEKCAKKKILDRYEATENNVEIHFNAMKVLEKIINRFSPTNQEDIIMKLLLCLDPTKHSSVRDLKGPERESTMRQNAASSLTSMLIKLNIHEEISADSPHNMKLQDAIRVANKMCEVVVTLLGNFPMQGKPKHGCSEVDKKMDLYDLLLELVSRFPNALEKYHDKLYKQIRSDIIASATPNSFAYSDARGRTTLPSCARKCLVVLAGAFSKKNFDMLIDDLKMDLVTNDKKRNEDILTNAIELSTDLAGKMPDRLINSIDIIISSYFNELNRLKNLNEDTDEFSSPESNNVRAAVLKGLSLLVAPMKWNDDIIVKISDTAASYVRWDPNACTDQDDDECDNEEVRLNSQSNPLPQQDDDNGSDEEFVIEYYEDVQPTEYVDSDNSWKVRHSALLCHETIITLRPDLLPTLILPAFFGITDTKPSLALIIRCLKESKPSVRTKVLNFLMLVVKICTERQKLSEEGGMSYQSSLNIQGSSHTSMATTGETNVFYCLKVYIIGALVKGTRHSESLVKQKSFAALRDVCVLIGDESVCETSISSKCVAAIIEAIGTEAVRRENNAFLVEVLEFSRFIVSALINSANVNMTQEKKKMLESLVQPIVECCGSLAGNSGVTALSLLSTFVRAVSLLGSPMIISKNMLDVTARHLSEKDDCCLSAIETISIIIGDLHSYLDSYKADVVKIYQQLNSLLLSHTDTSVVYASRAICKLVKNLKGVNIPKSEFISWATNITALLKKSDSQIREAAVSCLVEIIGDSGSLLSESIITDVVKALRIRSADQSGAILFTNNLQGGCVSSFNLAKEVLNIPGRESKDILAYVVPASLQFLSDSAVTHGPVLEAVRKFFAALGAKLSHIKPADYDKTANDILKVIYDVKADSNQNFESVIGVAAAFGAFITADKNREKNSRKVQTIAIITDKFLLNGNDSATIASAAVLGEVGLSTDLTEFPAAFDALLLKAAGRSEAIRVSSARALGRACALEPGHNCLKKVIAQLKQGSPETTVNKICIEALREATSYAYSSNYPTPFSNGNTLSEIVDVIGSFVFKPEVASYWTSPDLDKAAEIMGRSVCWNQQMTFEKLRMMLDSAAFAVSAGVFEALRYVCMTTSPCTAPPSVVEFLVVAFGYFKRLGRDSITLRRKAIHLIKYILADRPVLYTKCLHDVVFPRMMAEATVDVTLVKSIDLGTFNVREDSGIDIRRGVFDYIRALVKNRQSFSFITTTNLEWMTAVAIDAIGPLNAAQEYCVGSYFDSPPEEEKEEEIYNKTRELLISTLCLNPTMQSVIKANLSLIGTKLESSLTRKVKPTMEPSEMEKIIECKKTAVILVKELQKLFPVATASSKGITACVNIIKDAEEKCV